MVQQRTEALDLAAPPYTLCCEPACEARVAQDLSRLATGIDSEVGEALRALCLTGPFARGEGGVRERDGEICAAEPGYQLLAIFKKRPERHAHALHTMGATWSRLLRAPVSIRPFAEDLLSNVVASRFWYHVGAGQVLTLVGDPALVRKVPQRGSALRSDEPARALCEGLYLLALAGLDRGAGHGVNLARVQQAVLLCGDAWLLRRGHYAPFLRERARSFQLLHAGAALRAGYAEAIAFSEHPERVPASAASASSFVDATRRWLAVWYLDFEAERAGTLRDALGYACDPRPLAAAWGGALPAASRAHPLRWPRRAPALPAIERLLRASVLLGFAPHVPACRREAARLMHPEPKRPELASSNEALAAALCALAREVLADPDGEPFAVLPTPSPAR